jgi:hypothetical protein
LLKVMLVRYNLQSLSCHSWMNFSSSNSSLPVSPDITGPDVHYRKPDIVTYVHLNRFLQVDGSTGWRLFAAGRLVYGRFPCAVRAISAPFVQRR